MSARVTAVLLVVFVALCAAYWWALSREDRNKVRVFEAKRVFSIKPGDLRKISIQRLDETPTVATRADEKESWAIVQPRPIDAFQHAWTRAADALANLSNERPINAGPVDLAQYGLDKPRVTVTATTADGKELRVALGAGDPTQTRVYAKTADMGIFMVPKEAVTDLDRPLLDLRNRFMVNVGESGITHLEYARIAGKDAPKGYNPGDESVSVVLDRESDGSWKMVKPVTGFANKTLADKLASEIQHLTGHGYVDAPESLEDYGLKPAAARVTIRSGANGEPQTVYFGAITKSDDDKGGLYAKRADKPAVFVIDGGIIANLPKTPDGFRDRRMFTRLDGEIQSLHYTSGLTDFTLELDPVRGWRVTQPPVPDSDQIVISNFIGLLKVMTCASFVEDVPAEAGLDRPAAELTISMKDKAQPVKIKLGAQVPNTETFYAMQDTGVVVRINRTDMNALTRNLADFRPKEFLRFDKTAATVVKMHFDGVDYEFEKAPANGAWAIRAPAGKIWESQNDMSGLLTALSTARMAGVESPTTPADLTVYGLDAPLITVMVTTQGGVNGATGATLGPLTVGKPAPSNAQHRFAIVQGRSEVFRIDQAFVDAVREVMKGIKAPPQ